MLDGPLLGCVEDFKELRMYRGLAARDLDNVRLHLIPHDHVEHAFHLLQGPVCRAVGATAGVTDGAVQIANVRDFQQREAGVLLVIRAKATIVRAAVLHGRIPMQRHLRWLDEDLAAAAVIIHVIGHEDTLETMLRAPLQHVDTVVLKDDLGVSPAETRSAQRNSGVVEEVETNRSAHSLFLFAFRSARPKEASNEAIKMSPEIRQSTKPQKEIQPPTLS